ncbi:MAG: hypothetical protein B1H03_03005 [Planctomycetales bacterium 4484_113]|nr:MAG: hypothetical protein B1H03_03005 [Planctomycetales bacterium 4484_113]
MNSRKSGFTLIELLVVIVIIGILVAIALPNFIKVREKAKEAEVKQNLHSIQLAVERYAVDNAYGNYPPYILGGDWTDSGTINEEYYYFAGLDQVPYPAWKGTGPDFAPEGEGDYLIMEGYMTVYPRNPFIRTGTIIQPRRLVHHAGTYWGTTWPRIVGGSENRSMVEVFGPPPAWVFQNKGIAGDLFVIPPYPDLSPGNGDWSGRPQKIVTEEEYRQPGSKLLVGNFSYFTRLNVNGWLLFNGAQQVNGYTLAGYGTLRNLGQDVYDRNGEYFPKQRTYPCPKGGGLPLNVGQLQCPAEGEPNSLLRSRGGPDSRQDGVIIVLDSGVDKKSTNEVGEIG